MEPDRPTLARATVDDLLERYDAFLLDAYGVLVNMAGALPGARNLLARIHAAGKAHLLLSNDASRLPGTTAARYAGFGLPIEEEHILTSGALIKPHLEDEGLVGAPCIVMGTPDSVRYVEQAGGAVVGFEDSAAQVVIVGDDDGYPFLRGIEQVLTTICRRIDRDDPVHLVLPNPDLIYPRGEDELGVASGSVALVLEHGLRVRYGKSAPRFVGLGKPHNAIFEAAMGRVAPASTDRTVMIGDQLRTDIKGARDFGIDSVLVGTGLTRVGPSLADEEVQPTWLLDGLG